MSWFTCPKCGSHEFGSTGRADEPLIRHCHGYTQVTERSMTPCGFTWPEADDEKYGLEPFVPSEPEPPRPGRWLEPEPGFRVFAPTEERASDSELELAYEAACCHGTAEPLRILYDMGRARGGREAREARELAIRECAKALGDSGDMYIESAEGWLLRKMGLDG